jgi:hypothetical protein
MRTLSNPDLLDLWERGRGLHPLDRALLTLAFALPGEPYDTIAAWPLGRRNGALVRVRHACFGSAFTGWVACPQCGERLEFSFDAQPLLEQQQEANPTVIVDGRAYRPPTSRDLAVIAAETDERAAALHLLRQCCTAPSSFTDSCEFTEAELVSIEDALAGADPLAEILLEFACAACSHRWTDSLDVAVWLWAEIEARARRLLFDVHTLAAAYGWSEPEVLSLSEPRRAVYLEMVRA